MNLALQERVIRYYKRNSAGRINRRLVPVELKRPLISFTFDDFPRSAWQTGGRILGQFGVTATYYVALGLMGKESPSGPICVAEDLKMVLKAGHELGSHTYSHLHSWDTDPKTFEESVVENGAALHKLIPGAVFRSFSYPISAPRPATKRRTSSHFECCREGGQTLNAGQADLNQLAAFFLERSRDDIGAVKRLIDTNTRERGWIIFATHDLEPQPSPYGCTPEFFSEVVQYAVSSGAQIVPVIQGVEIVRGERTV